MSTPAKYRSNPVEVSAARWTGGNTSEVIDWILANSIRSARWHDAGEKLGQPQHIAIDSPAGKWIAGVGDWIVILRTGEVEVYGPNSFALAFTPAADHHARLSAGTEALRDSDGHCNGQDCIHGGGTEEG